MKTQKLKQTEIGEIPEDWDLISFKDAFNFLPTATYSRADLNGNGKLLYIHYGDIHTRWTHFLDCAKNELPSIDKIQQKTCPLIKEGDLILADASEDYEGICKSIEIKNLGDNKIISGLHTFLLRDKNNHFSNGFRGYIISNKMVKSQLDTLATGLKVYGVSKGNLKVVLIPHPSPKEQSAIAQVLSNTDALIEKLNELIIKKKNIKQGTMQQLLTGKKRLKGFSDEWEDCLVSEIIELNKGQQLNRSNLTEKGEYPAWNGGIEPSGYTHKFNTKANTITISEGGNSCGFINYCITDFWCGGHCYAIKILNSSIDKKYLYNLLKFKEPQIMYLRIGSGLPNIQKKNLYEFKMNFPKDPKEQIAIAQIISDMDSEIKELERKKDKYQKIKIGMMQQLLTGRIRLKYG